MLDDILGKGKHVTIVVNDLSRLDDDNPHEKKVKDRLYGLNNQFGKTNFVLADFKKHDGFMHAKVIVADRNKMVIGSANLSNGGLKKPLRDGSAHRGGGSWDGREDYTADCHQQGTVHHSTAKQIVCMLFLLSLLLNLIDFKFISSNVFKFV